MLCIYGIKYFFHLSCNFVISIFVRTAELTRQIIFMFEIKKGIIDCNTCLLKGKGRSSFILNCSHTIAVGLLNA